MYFNCGLSYAFEIEYTTGVTSNFIRRIGLKNAAEYLDTHCVIVAPDADRDDVMKKIDQKKFEHLNLLYSPFSNVDEVYLSTAILNLFRESNGSFSLIFTEQAG